jgi:predicted secreted protein
MDQRRFWCELLALVSIAIPVCACGSQQNAADIELNAASLVLRDQVANHAFSLVVGQTVAIQVINRSAPASASDGSVLERTNSLDSPGGRVTIFKAVRPGSTVIDPGPVTCGLVACANSGIQATMEEFYIFVTDNKNKVATVLTLIDNRSLVTLKQGERAALLLPNKAPFGHWDVSDATADPAVVRERVDVTTAFTWATFTLSKTGRYDLQAIANPDCNASSPGCPSGRRDFSVTVSVAAQGASTVLVLGDQDNGKQIELRVNEIVELVLRQPPFDTGQGRVVSIHPNVVLLISSSSSSGVSKVDFRAVGAGSTQLQSVEPNCPSAGSRTCHALYELNIYVFQ